MSFANSGSPLEFILKRTLRIFPGLAVVVLVCMFVLGPAVTSLPVAEYFSNSRTFTYLSNIGLYRMQYDLPGVFENNPRPMNTNGSLWTLWYEVVCYGSVLFLGVTGLLRWKVIIAVLALLFLVTINLANVPIIWRANDILATLRWQEDYIELLTYFCCGSLIYLLREKIPLWPYLASLALVTLALILAVDAELFSRVFAVAGAYLTMYLAFSTKLKLGNFSKSGDYSYGMYIYAYPIQQATYQIMAPDISWIVNFAIAFPVTLLFAVASWHWIEKPSLALKPHLHTWLASSNPPL